VAGNWQEKVVGAVVCEATCQCARIMLLGTLHSWRIDIGPGAQVLAATTSSGTVSDSRRVLRVPSYCTEISEGAFLLVECLTKSNRPLSMPMPSGPSALGNALIRVEDARRDSCKNCRRQRP
jgi:hypothetical protein